MATYPTRGIELIVPSKAEIRFTGWGINFNRRGRDYAVRYLPSGLSIERDGLQIRKWDDLPANVQAIITKAHASYAAAMAN